MVNFMEWKECVLCISQTEQTNGKLPPCLSVLLLNEDKVDTPDAVALNTDICLHVDVSALEDVLIECASE